MLDLPKCGAWVLAAYLSIPWLSLSKASPLEDKVLVTYVTQSHHQESCQALCQQRQLVSLVTCAEV